MRATSSSTLSVVTCDVVGLVEEVADLGEERGVLLRVGPPGMLPVEVVDAGLQLLAPGEQLAVARRQVVDDRVQARPERVRLDPRARERLLGHEAVQALGHAEPADLDSVAHDNLRDSTSRTCVCAHLRP